MLTPVLAVNQSTGLLGLMSLKPPSPKFTVTHAGFVPDEVAGDPLSCVPPMTVEESVGCWENHINCVSDPNDAFRLSKGFATAHDPERSW